MCDGRSTKPGMAENTWVMPRVVRVARFSASAKSERYNLGMISVGPTGGTPPGPLFGRGRGDEVGVLGGAVCHGCG